MFASDLIVKPEGAKINLLLKLGYASIKSALEELIFLGNKPVFAAPLVFQKSSPLSIKSLCISNNPLLLFFLTVLDAPGSRS